MQWIDLPNTTTPINAQNLNINGNVIGNIVDTYSNSNTYKVGDLVTYNEILYKCITAISTAEDFDSTKWSQTSLIDEINTFIRFEEVSTW